MINNRLLYRTARTQSRGGFTLVELLVVIGIIAILAGVALGPITNGIKKAKQSAGLQTAHAIGLSMYSFANDNNQSYPDVNNPSSSTFSADASADAQALLAGNYVTDPSIFYISGGVASKYTGTVASAITNIAATNISWDFFGNASKGGLSSTNYQYMPIFMSSIVGGTQMSLTGGSTAGTILTVMPASTNPFGTGGVAVFYINNSAAFVTPVNVAGSLECVVVPTTSNAGGAPTLTLLQGGG
jgi:prepilin-type N-terminal cleavage/methylation domain-containing protein